MGQRSNMSSPVLTPHPHSPCMSSVYHMVRWLMIFGVAVVATGDIHAAYPASIDNFLLRKFEIVGDFTLTNQLGGKTSLEDLGARLCCSPLDLRIARMSAQRQWPIWERCLDRWETKQNL